ncbi:FUSC family protein [Arthrobacter sp. lap29]|uniref:FUSC family protein n=1 Tax=Arthrobacter sp. lap29 TaxID=3056122 RepID=UPI0028F72E30|nr:FUSC family protein [Arthrobacter sp. lap29]
MIMTSRLRHCGTALAHSVAPRTWYKSLAIHPADAIFAPAIKVGIAASLVLVAGGLMGQQQLAGVATLGALTSAFGRYQPYRRLAPMLGIVAAAMLVTVGIGALLGAMGVPMAAQIAVLSLIAGLASHIFAAFRITGPGAVIMVFAAAAGAAYANSLAGVAPVVAALGIGAAVGWLAAMAPVLVNPLGPARLAVARSITAVVRLATQFPADASHGGTHLGAARAAVRGARGSVALSASSSFGSGSGTVRPATVRARQRRQDAEALNLILNEVESVIATVGHASSKSLALALQRLWGYEHQLRTLRGKPSAGARPGSSPATGPQEPRNFWRTAGAGLRSRASTSQALRMAGASALSGWAAVGLGLDHPLWASMGAVAALQGLNYGHTVQRGIQRLLGNVIGAVLAIALLSLSLSFWPSVALVIVFQVLAELLVMKNYTLTTIAVTPMALIMTGLGSHLGPAAAFSRVADTLVGVVIGVLVAAVSIPLADHHHLPKVP